MDEPVDKSKGWLFRALAWLNNTRLAKESRRARREMDLNILWPQFKKLAPDMLHAKVGFMYHVTRDPVWTSDYTLDELYELVDQLE